MADGKLSGERVDEIANSLWENPQTLKLLQSEMLNTQAVAMDIFSRHPEWGRISRQGELPARLPSQSMMGPAAALAPDEQAEEISVMESLEPSSKNKNQVLFNDHFALNKIAKGSPEINGVLVEGKHSIVEDVDQQPVHMIETAEGPIGFKVVRTPEGLVKVADTRRYASSNNLLVPVGENLTEVGPILFRSVIDKHVNGNVDSRSELIKSLNHLDRLFKRSADSDTTEALSSRIQSDIARLENVANKAKNDTQVLREKVMPGWLEFYKLQAIYKAIESNAIAEFKQPEDEE